MKIAQNSNGDLIGILDAPNGKNCNCTCLGCGNPLIAKNGGKKREKHFAHVGDSNCSAGMTWLHKAAQSIIETANSILLPSGETFVYTEAMREFSVPGFIADVMIQNQEQKILIEVVVSHDLDDDKIAKINNSGLSCIRIDLSDIEREIGLKELKDLLLKSAKHRKWVRDLQGFLPVPTLFDNKHNQAIENEQDREVNESNNPDSSIDFFAIFILFILAYFVARVLGGSNRNSASNFSDYRNARRDQYRR